MGFAIDPEIRKEKRYRVCPDAIRRRRCRRAGGIDFL
jgi:hypothetical protein